MARLPQKLPREDQWKPAIAVQTNLLDHGTVRTGVPSTLTRSHAVSAPGASDYGRGGSGVALDEPGIQIGRPSDTHHSEGSGPPSSTDTRSVRPRWQQTVSLSTVRSLVLLDTNSRDNTARSHR